VDLAALRHNTTWLQSRLQPGTELYAVVKCNAYGHGMNAVARTVLAAGASRLVVATLQEALELRRQRVRAPVLVLGPLQTGDVHEVLQGALTPAVADLELCRALSAASRTEVGIHVKIDTGMSRYGVPAPDAAAFASALAAMPRLRVEGVFTHFSGRSTRDLPAMRSQLEQFHGALAAFRAHGHDPLAHAASTLSALALPESHGDAVRIGGGLYGFDPDPDALRTPLRPVLALKTRVAAVKAASAGTPVGYGSTHVCCHATALAVLPLGYGDGLLREVWQGAEVLVRGARAPIVGLINMNQTVIDVTGVPGVAIGDEVMLLGRQGSERVRAEDHVGADGTAYAVTCLLPERLPRVLRVDATPERFMLARRSARPADPAAPRRRP
jgi:alanine racemase